MTCCPPVTPDSSDFSASNFKSSPSAKRPVSVPIPSGQGMLGTAKPMIRGDAEGPLRKGLVRPISMSIGAITNAEFAAFVADTGYVTEAEHLGWSFVFWSQVPKYIGQTQSVPGAPWWHRVDGAAWHRITGPKCTLMHELLDHPVVHVSWNDATAYASWVGGRLPTELEWEHAARGGLGDVRFPWGDDEPDDKQNIFCNIWQGRFPKVNTTKDGYYTTGPSISFEPNGLGLFNMVGNVWEWTSDSLREHPQIDITSTQKTESNVMKVVKGGSFLCHKSYCYRYRIAARIANSIDSATTHMSFRVVWDLGD